MNDREKTQLLLRSCLVLFGAMLVAGVLLGFRYPLMGAINPATLLMMTGSFMTIETALIMMLVRPGGMWGKAR